ncbi:facilitated trehalose transporter Tret1-like isoform X2 [Chelonus insularis]|uniref:facilitated trehalose transporter Tret1-like isoform X2 n=1 Tax=Chelonus insularis TaxID=460826 RepID=UPI00158F04AA|nr:facilitated trehalose transporter Tret1-like isoform X2 [Chelonus insularis]
MTTTTDALINNPEQRSKVSSTTSVNVWSQWKQWLAAITATLSMVAVGTVYGWTTTSLERLKNGTDVPVTITDDQASWLVSLTVIASMCGSFLGACLADLYGRKFCLLCSSGFFTTGWLAVIFAKNVSALYTARTILGISVGMSYTTNPMYVSEVADTNIRGALGTLIAVNVFTGSLITCSIGPYVSYVTLGIALLIIPIVFVVSFVWFPESPHFLAMKGKKNAAVEAIIFFKNVNMERAHEELTIILSNINEYRSHEQSWILKIKRLLSYNNSVAFLIVFMMIVIQQLSGNFTTMQFLTGLFIRANVGIDADTATIIVFAVGLVSGTVATMTVEKAGRRRLLMLSSFLCAGTLLILAIYLYLPQRNIDVSAVNLLPLIVIVLFQIAYQIGLGTLPNAMIGELFPTNAKSIAAAGITISDGILGFIVSTFYTKIEKSLGTYFLYFFFSGSCFIGFIFILFCVPETKNKSLTEIQDELSKSRFRYSKSWRSSKQEVETDIPTNCTSLNG